MPWQPSLEIRFLHRLDLKTDGKRLDQQGTNMCYSLFWRNKRSTDPWLLLLHLWVGNARVVFLLCIVWTDLSCDFELIPSNFVLIMDFVVFFCIYGTAESKGKHHSKYIVAHLNKILQKGQQLYKFLKNLINLFLILMLHLKLKDEKNKLGKLVIYLWLYFSNFN